MKKTLLTLVVLLLPALAMAQSTASGKNESLRQMGIGPGFAFKCKEITLNGTNGVSFDNTNSSTKTRENLGFSATLVNFWKATSASNAQYALFPEVLTPTNTTTAVIYAKININGTNYSIALYK
jgi:hypothetical protein